MNIHSAGAYSGASHLLINTGNLQIEYKEIDIMTDTTLYFSFTEPFLCLCINIGRQINFNADKNRQVSFSEHQYNFFSGPAMDFNCNLQKGNYQMLMVHFPYSYLSYPANSIIKPGTSAMLFAEQQETDHHMLILIKHIIHSQMAVTGVQQDAWLLIDHCLKKRDDHHTHMLTISSADNEKLLKIKTYLLENLDQPTSIRKLSRMYGMNEFYLKKGFKQLFSTNISDFIQRERLEMARGLILTTDRPMKDIALLAGYSNTANFSNAFKKKYGIPPARFKKIY
jgi:AraC-like DNA-binding protein